MFPFAIQSDIIANWASDIVTPISGRIFGCRRAFHVTTSLQNLYTGHCQCTDTERSRDQELTPIIFCKSLFEYVLMTFTATSRPQCSPFHTSANPPLYDATPPYKTEIFKTFGRSAWRPQVLYNDLRHFFRVWGERSALSSA